MKKLFVYCLLLLSPSVWAESGVEHFRRTSGFDFYMGISAWYTNAAGGFKSPDANQILDYYSLEFSKNQTNGAFNGMIYTAFEHPIKYLPDIQLSYNSIRHTGDTNWIYSLKTNPIYFIIPTSGKLDLSHSDMTFYYNVFSDTHSPVNGFIYLGATARHLSGSLTLNISNSIYIYQKITSQLSGPLTISTSNKDYTSDLSTTLALLYLKTGMSLPSTGISMGIILNIGSLGDKSSNDASLYMQYEAPYGVGVTGGYRFQKTKIDAQASISQAYPPVKIQADFDIEGPYLSIYYHF